MTFWEALNSIWAKNYYLWILRDITSLVLIIIAFTKRSYSIHYKVLLLFIVINLIKELFSYWGHALYFIGVKSALAEPKYHAAINYFMVFIGYCAVFYFQRKTIKNKLYPKVMILPLLTFLVYTAHEIFMIFENSTSILRTQMLSSLNTFDEMLTVPGTIIFFLEMINSQKRHDLSNYSDFWAHTALLVCSLGPLPVSFLGSAIHSFPDINTIKNLIYASIGMVFYLTLIKAYSCKTYPHQ